jgi:hypothetical protein
MGANDDSADHPDNTKLEHQGWSDIKEMKRGFVVVDARRLRRRSARGLTDLDCFVVVS